MSQGQGKIIQYWGYDSTIHRPDIRYGSVNRLFFAGSVRFGLGLAEPNRTSRAHATGSRPSGHGY